MVNPAAPGTSEPLLYRCHRCKMESEVEAAFSRDLLGRRTCPNCIELSHRRSTLANYLLFPLLGLLLYAIPSWRWVGWALLQFCAVIFLTLPLIILHEIAHAGTANLLGLKAFRIIIGTGRTLFTRRALGLDWELRSFPWGGGTAVSGLPLPRFRLRLALVYLSGPLLHGVLLLTFGLAWLLVALFGLGFWPLKVLELAFYSNLLILVANLWPRRLSSTTGSLGTDTWNLARLFRMKPGDLDPIHADYYFLESYSALERGQLQEAARWVEQGLDAYPAALHLQNLRGVIATQEYDYATAYETFQHVLEQVEKLPHTAPEAQTGFRYLIRNNVAFTGLMMQDEALLPEVDLHSQAAYANMPWQPAIAGTRGAVLVRLEKAEEGLPLLKLAMAHNRKPADKAVNACFVAMGEAILGRISKARVNLALAKKWDPHCPMIPPVEAALEEKQPSATSTIVEKQVKDD